MDLSLNADLPSRIFSAYENPNAFAEVLVFLIPVAVGLLLGARSLWWKLVGLGLPEELAEGAAKGVPAACMTA